MVVVKECVEVEDEGLEAVLSSLTLWEGESLVVSTSPSSVWVLGADQGLGVAAARVEASAAGAAESVGVGVVDVRAVP